MAGAGAGTSDARAGRTGETLGGGERFEASPHVEEAGEMIGSAAPERAVDQRRTGKARGKAVLRRVGTSPSARLLGRRLVSAIPTLWLVSFFTFVLMNVLPNDTAAVLLGSGATPGQVKALSAKLHLNEPFWSRYGTWLGSTLHGNLGTSLQSGQATTTVLGNRLPVTFELVLYAFVASLVIAIPLALVAARRPGGLVDRVTLLMSSLALSFAPYVLALVLVLAFAVHLNWFPVSGWVPITQNVGQNLQALTLPALSLGLWLVAFYVRLLRADLVEQMQSEDYVATAKSKGLTESRILLRHAFKNSLFPLISVIGLNFARVIEGTVVIETIFGLPGIGQELIQAIQVKDVPIVEGIVLVMGVVVVLANLVTDVMYGLLDPRIRYGRAGA